MNFLKPFNLFNRKSYNLKYWNKRVKKHGKLAVLNLAHSLNEWDQVTDYQKKEIYPLFKQQLTGSEKLLLDFGCGPGRFTPDLADMINGNAIGIDIVPELIKMAPVQKNIKYLIMKGDIIPLGNNSIDIIWSCLVLGGINEADLIKTRSEFNRILNKNGLLFLVENTSDKPSSDYWFFRNFEFYTKFFSEFNLNNMHCYLDCNEQISIMAGRRNV